MLRVALACGGALVGIIVVSVLAVTLLGDPSAEKALVIPTTVTTSKPAPTQWQRWTASDGSFGVDVPTPPQFGPVPGDQSDFATTEQAVSTYGKTEYGMFYFQLPSDYYFPDPYPTMNSVLDGLSEDIGVTYSSRTRGTFGFLPSLSFTGSMDGGAGTVQGMAFVSEQRFYVMYAEAYDGELVDYQHFVDSFATG